MESALTLNQLIARLQAIAAERPEAGNLPVYVSRQKNRRTMEYIPIRYVYSGRLTVHFPDGRSVTMVECKPGIGSVNDGVIEFHRYGPGSSGSSLRGHK